MTMVREIIRFSLPILVLCASGTVLTLGCLWKRKKISRLYSKIRHSWRSYRETFPQWAILVFRFCVGTVGMGVILIGFVLMPLPGPGSMLVLAGAGLMDLEFGWIVPVLEWIFERCPERWIPETFSLGLNNLRDWPDHTERRT